MRKYRSALRFGMNMYRTDTMKIGLGYEGSLESKSKEVLISVFDSPQLESFKNKILTDNKEQIRDSWNQVVTNLLPAIYDQAFEDGFENQFDLNSQGLRTVGSENGYGFGLHAGIDIAKNTIEQRLPGQHRLRMSLLRLLEERSVAVEQAIQGLHLLEGDEIVPALSPLAYEIKPETELECKMLDSIPSETDPGYNALLCSLTDPNEPVPQVFENAFVDAAIASQKSNQTVLNQNHLQLVHSIGGTIEVSISPVLSRITPLNTFTKYVDIGISTSLQKQIDVDTFFKVNKGWKVDFSVTFEPKQEITLQIEDKQICEVGLKYQINKKLDSTLRVDCCFNNLFGQSKKQSQQTNNVSQQTNNVSQQTNNVSQQQINQSEGTREVATACTTCPDRIPSSINSSRQVFVGASTPQINHHSDFVKTPMTTLLSYFAGLLLALTLFVGFYFQFPFLKRLLRKKIEKPLDE